MRLSYLEGADGGSRLDLSADDYRTGLTFDLGASPPGRLTSVWITVPFGEMGNSTWGLRFREGVRWLPDGDVHDGCIAATGAYEYRVSSDATKGRWTLAAEPLGSGAEWMSSLRLSITSETSLPPWARLSLQLRHVASDFGLNCDLELDPCR
jgi:hypothetical protein